ncbi:MAG: putative Ig domain-containing protein, partial [Myxococcota bacterium]
VDRLSNVARTTLAIEVSSLSDLLIDPTNLSPIIVGEPVDVPLSVVGGVPPYTWDALTPAPPGLQFSATGRLVGIPTTVGTWPVRVRVTDSKRQPGVDDAVLRIIIEADGLFEIVTTRLPQGRVRTTYEAFIEVDGGEPPFVWRIVPGTSLPAGFFLTEATMSGRPSMARIFGRGLFPVDQAFAVRVEDGAGRRREVALVLSLSELSADGEAEGCVCVAANRRGSKIGIGMMVLLTIGWMIRRWLASVTTKIGAFRENDRTQFRSALAADVGSCSSVCRIYRSTRWFGSRDSGILRASRRCGVLGSTSF